MNIRPMMRSPGHVTHLLPARRLGEPELHRDRFSYPFFLSFAVIFGRTAASGSPAIGGAGDVAEMVDPVVVPEARAVHADYGG